MLILKNESVIRHLGDLRVPGQDPERETLRVVSASPSIPGDGKDLCDLCAANCNRKIDREVNSGFSIDNARCQAEAIVRGEGVANTIVFLGKIEGGQATIKNKKIKDISKIHSFEFTDEGVIVRRVAGIGPGKLIKLDPLEVTTKFNYTIMNPEHQLLNGIPTKQTRNLADKSKKSHLATPSQPSGDTTKKLTIMEHLRHSHVQSFGMGNLQEFQPEVDIGSKSLLTKLEVPAFSEKLLELKAGTKWTGVNETLQNLPVGHANPIWGGGKNKSTPEAKAYLAQIFEEGVDGRSMLASEAFQRMQEATVEPTSREPLFNADTFMDEEQITYYFGSLNKPKPRKNSISKSAKRQAVPASIAPEGVIGLDFEDNSHGNEQQTLAEELQDMRGAEGAMEMQREASQIESSSLYDETAPIIVAGFNLCEAAEQITALIGNPLKKLTQQQKQEIANTVEPDPTRRIKILKNT